MDLFKMDFFYIECVIALAQEAMKTRSLAFFKIYFLLHQLMIIARVYNLQLITRLLTISLDFFGHILLMIYLNQYHFSLISKILVKTQVIDQYDFSESIRF